MSGPSVPNSRPEAARRASEKPMPSATNILQPQSAHVLAVNGYTVSSGHPLAKDPEHLYHAKQMFQLCVHAVYADCLHSDFTSRDHDVCEVFSRGQNPQHWHIAKRGLGSSSPTDAGGGGSENAVYMEVFRKETSLTDVDNVLAGVVRKSGLSTGLPKSR